VLDETPSLPDFTRWPSFPFEGDMRVKHLNTPVDVEPPRSGEDSADCVACNTPDDAYIWVSERWRVRGMDRPTGLPMVLILECRSHLDLGDLPNLLAAELGVMTVRLERAIRSLDGVARVHVNRWGDGSAHLHLWFLARPYGRLQLRGTFLSLWDDILPVIPEEQWLGNLALVAAWLAGFGGRAIAEPPHIHWESPSTFSSEPAPTTSPPDNTQRLEAVRVNVAQGAEEPGDGRGDEVSGNGGYDAESSGNSMDTHTEAANLSGAALGLASDGRVKAADGGRGLEAGGDVAEPSSGPGDNNELEADRGARGGSADSLLPRPRSASDSERSDSDQEREASVESAAGRPAQAERPVIPSQFRPRDAADERTTDR
jgi:hypothetical protein